MAKTSKDRTLSIRLSQTMLEALDARAGREEKDRAQVIREAIAQHLEMDEDELHKKLSFFQESVSKLQSQYQRDRKQTEALGKRMDEISRLVSYCLERLAPGKT